MGYGIIDFNSVVIHVLNSLYSYDGIRQIMLMAANCNLFIYSSYHTAATKSPDISSHIQIINDYFLSDHLMDYCMGSILFMISIAFSMSVIADYINCTYYRFHNFQSMMSPSSANWNDIQFSYFVMGYTVLSAFNYMVNHDIVSPNSIDRDRFYVILRRLNLPSYFYLRFFRIETLI